jgi:hypothetical protein
LTDDSIFTAKVDDSTTNESKDELTVLRKRLSDKDAFIKQLESETSELRSELKTRASVEELFEKNKTVASTPVTNPAERTEGTNTLSLDDMRRIAAEVLTNETTKAQRSNNLKAAVTELKKAWGDNYVGTLQAKTEELGVGQNFLDEVAAKSPKALLQLLGVGTPKEVINPAAVTPPTGTRTVIDANTGVRNEAYYAELRKTDRDKYLSQEVQMQRHKDALALGEAFFTK